MTVEHILQRVLLASSKLPFAINRQQGVSTSVEQSLVHLSSPSSSLAELNPLTFSFLPCFLLPPFLRLPLLHYFAGIVVQLQKHLRCSILFHKTTNHTVEYLQWDESKFLFLRLTLKDVGFTLGWWLWLSRLGLNESTVATYRHYTTLN